LYFKQDVFVPTKTVGIDTYFVCLLSASILLYGICSFLKVQLIPTWKKEPAFCPRMGFKRPVTESLFISCSVKWNTVLSVFQIDTPFLSDA